MQLKVFTSLIVKLVTSCPVGQVNADAGNLAAASVPLVILLAFVVSVVAEAASPVTCEAAIVPVTVPGKVELEVAAIKFPLLSHAATTFAGTVPDTVANSAVEPE